MDGRLRPGRPGLRETFELAKGDGLIAYTWRRFMEENGDMHERLLLAPMVKAAVLAMNATDDILHQEDCGIGPSAKKCRTSDVRYNLYGINHNQIESTF